MLGGRGPPYTYAFNGHLRSEALLIEQLSIRVYSTLITLLIGILALSLLWQRRHKIRPVTIYTLASAILLSIVVLYLALVYQPTLSWRFTIITIKEPPLWIFEPVLMMLRILAWVMLFLRKIMDILILVVWDSGHAVVRGKRYAFTVDVRVLLAVALLALSIPIWYITGNRLRAAPLPPVNTSLPRQPRRRGGLYQKDP